MRMDAPTALGSDLVVAGEGDTVAHSLVRRSAVVHVLVGLEPTHKLARQLAGWYA